MFEIFVYEMVIVQRIGNFKIVKDMRAEAGLKKILLHSRKSFANFHEVMTKCDIFFLIDMYCNHFYNS